MVNNNYYLAMTIRERISCFKKAGIDLITDSVYLDRWLNIRGLSSINETRQFCEMTGITIEEFTYVLKTFETYEIDILNTEVYDSDWYKELQNVLAFFTNAENKLDELSSNIVYPVRPFVLFFLQKISNKLLEIENIKLTENAWTQVTDWISSLLANVVIRIITLGIHEFKKTTNINEETIFEAYMKQHFGDESLLEIFYNEYPTMTRLLIEKMTLSINHLSNVIDRINVNREKLNSFIDTNEFVIDKIQFGQGDSHSGGQAVIVIEFANSNKIVYKPKNLKVERQFNKLIDWLNQLNEPHILDMSYGKAIYCDDYTFNEFIFAKECNSILDVKKYYQRLGQLLFILHTINGTDFHFENIISSCGNVYLIDLETVFQIANIDILPNLESAEGKIYKEFGDSVLCIGILPLLGFNQNAEGLSVDISALNGGKQKLPYKVLSLKNVNTPEMIFDYDYPELSETNNIPVLNGQKQPFVNFVDDLALGYKNMQEFVLKNKEKYRQKIVEMFDFEDILVRQLTKATANYATLLQYENHPNYLRDMVYMEKLLENLMSYPYRDKRIVPYEMKDMLNGDIPIFFSSLTNKDIICSTFGVIKSYFSISPLERAIEKIEKLCSESVSMQYWMFLNSIGKIKEERLNTINCINQYPIKMAEYADFSEALVLDSLKLINNHLENQRVFADDGEDFTWVKYKDINIQHEPIDTSYFFGGSGLGTYYYYLYKVTNETRYFEIYKTILQRIDLMPIKAYDQNPALLSNIILFTTCKAYSNDIYHKYFNYTKSLLSKVLKSKVKLDDLNSKVLFKISIAFHQFENDEEFCEMIKEYSEIVYSNNFEYEVDEILFLNTGSSVLQNNLECTDKFLKLVEYADEIVIQKPIKIWKKSVKDTYSEGVLYIANALIDVFGLTNNERYLAFAKELLSISVLSFEKNGTFRMLTTFDKMDVSLNDGYSGLAYTLLRTFVDNKLPNIFTLNADYL